MRKILIPFKILCSLCKRFSEEFKLLKDSLHRVFGQYPFIHRSYRLIKMAPYVLTFIYITNRCLFINAPLIINLKKFILSILLFECYGIFVELLFILVWKLLLFTSKSQSGIKARVQIITRRTLYDAEENVIFKQGEVIVEFDYLKQADPYDLYYFISYSESEYLLTSNIKKWKGELLCILKKILLTFATMPIYH